MQSQQLRISRIIRSDHRQERCVFFLSIYRFFKELTKKSLQLRLLSSNIVQPSRKKIYFSWKWEIVIYGFTDSGITYT
ncbi:MAG: hypothetical protein D3904_14025 [Candidatus Electrothrix sp. EH2]|nr:hypothetical protein [Candidatus Electrothrix sp. EH2]